jgi:hypothetical protein
LLPDELSTRAVLVTAYVLLIVLGCRRLIRRHDHGLLLHLVVPILVTYTGLTVMRVFYTPRYGAFLLLHMIALLSLGALEVWTLLRRSRTLRALAFLTGAALVVVGMNHTVDETQKFPRENMKLVGTVVDGSGIDEVVTNSKVRAGLDFYLGEERVQAILDPVALIGYLCFRPEPFIFIEHNYGKSPPDTNCLEKRGAIRVHVDQNSRGPVDIWFVEGKPLPVH